jgi:hypothetical protein
MKLHYVVKSPKAMVRNMNLNFGIAVGWPDFVLKPALHGKYTVSRVARIAPPYR